MSLSNLLQGDSLTNDRGIPESDAVERARRTVGVKLEPAECRAGELVAFDVLVEDIGQTGRWAQLSTGRGKVWWTHDVEDETDGCDGEQSQVVAALRRTVPVTPNIVRRAEQIRANARVSVDARPNLCHADDHIGPR